MLLQLTDETLPWILCTDPDVRPWAVEISLSCLFHSLCLFFGTVWIWAFVCPCALTSSWICCHWTEMPNSVTPESVFFFFKPHSLIGPFSTPVLLQTNTYHDFCSQYQREIKIIMFSKCVQQQHARQCRCDGFYYRKQSIRLQKVTNCNNIQDLVWTVKLAGYRISAGNRWVAPVSSTSRPPLNKQAPVRKQQQTVQSSLKLCHDCCALESSVLCVYYK